MTATISSPCGFLNDIWCWFLSLRTYLNIITILSTRSTVQEIQFPPLPPLPCCCSWGEAATCRAHGKHHIMMRNVCRHIVALKRHHSARVLYATTQITCHHPTITRKYFPSCYTQNMLKWICFKDFTTVQLNRWFYRKQYTVYCNITMLRCITYKILRKQHPYNVEEMYTNVY